MHTRHVHPRLTASPLLELSLLHAHVCAMSMCATLQWAFFKDEDPDLVTTGHKAGNAMIRTTVTEQIDASDFLVAYQSFQIRLPVR